MDYLHNQKIGRTQIDTGKGKKRKIVALHTQCSKNMLTYINSLTEMQFYKKLKQQKLRGSAWHS